MIFYRHANLKYNYANKQFGYKEYYVDTVGRNNKAVEEYIKSQIQEDIAYKHMSLTKYIDPFTGEQVSKLRKISAFRRSQ